MATLEDDDDDPRDYRYHEPLDEDKLDEKDHHSHDLPTARCTRCRKWMVEESECCPHCGEYQLSEYRNRPKTWFIVTAILCILLIGGGVILSLLGILTWFH